MNSSDLFDKIIAIAFVAIFFAAMFGAIGTMIGGPTAVDAEVRLGTSDSGPLPDYEVSNLTAQQTLGTGLGFDGAGSASASGVPELGANWSVCTWARVDAVDRNQTVAVYDHAHIQYAGNRSSAQWVGYLYDEGEREEYDVAVAAPDPTNRTHLCLQETGENLTLYRNSTASPTVETTGTHSLTDGGVGFGGLNGSVDETRVYDPPLNATERQALRDHPSRPLATATPLARLMYDRRTGASPFPVYFTSGELAVEGGTLVGGVPGDTLQDGVDYRVENGSAPPRVVALDGGDLDGAPTVFVSYQAQGLQLDGSLLSAWNILQNVIVLLALGLLGAAGYFAKQAMEGDL